LMALTYNSSEVPPISDESQFFGRAEPFSSTAG
jgi:hypothetical protein